MSERTKIQWADSTWSPWRGCMKVSEGCAHCYAETLAKRNPAVLGGWGKGAPRVLSKSWGDPVRWNQKNIVCVQCGLRLAKPQGHLAKGGKKCGFVDGDGDLDVKFIETRPRIFPSLCDWLDDEVPVGWLAQFLALIHGTPNLDWLLLTKRPELFEARFKSVLSERNISKNQDCSEWRFIDDWINGHPPSNVWMGVSVENQKRAEERIPILLKIPAALRWLSLEPMLGSVDLTHLDAEGAGHPDWCQINAMAGKQSDMGRPCPDIPKLDWLVIGGESGDHARPCSIEWIRSLLKQGTDSGVPVFVKQIGAMATVIREPERPWRGETLMRPYVKDPKGGDPAEWPEDLRVRQMPKGR